MNEESLKFSENFIPATYVRQAGDVLRSRENIIRQLWQHKKIPENGWDDLNIETLLLQLSSMDSNNFPSNSGVGERESRFASTLVAKRHYYFGHGIGRSGDLIEPQPKAAGSSLMYKITNCMLNDLMKLMGLHSPIECLLVPVATGMALVLSMLTLHSLRPKTRYVLWSRIDQKSCFKSILTAGFIPVIIDTSKQNDELTTNLTVMEDKIKDIGSENIVCVMSTTSCFAPRTCDNIEAVSKLCKLYNIPHIINNAYGLQSKYIMKRIQSAYNKGRVDVFVQSTDKNLMVPVGGSIISSFDKNLLEKVAKVYPGRASSAPLLDCFITLLSLGKSGYEKLCSDRIIMYDYLKEKLTNLAITFGERVLDTPSNPISIGMTLSKIPHQELTKLGSMLFLRNVSGTRVITSCESKNIADYSFEAWGAHSKDVTIPYLTAAASIGMKHADVDIFIKRLEKVMNQIHKKQHVDMSSQEETVSPIIENKNQCIDK